MWCVAELDEEYIARMEDVLAVYEKPLLAREPVVCIDEKPVVLHREVRPPVAMRPGRVARRDGEYQRCGTANVFCGVQPKAGRHFTKVTNDRSSPEFADYLLDSSGHRTGWLVIVISSAALSRAVLPPQGMSPPARSGSLPSPFWPFSCCEMDVRWRMT